MLNKAIDILNSHGVKPSAQRLAIMEYLMSHPVHPTADTIHAALVGRMPTLSKTTVYNTLKLFVDSGAATMLTINEKNVNFDADTQAHAHFLCSECGEIYDVGEDAELLKNVAHLDVGFELHSTALYLRGKCPKCVAKEKEDNKN